MNTTRLFFGDELGLRDYGKRNAKKKPYDESCEVILKALRNGEQPPRATGGGDVANALTRLRRQGLIENIGTRARPHWVIADL